MRYQEILTPQSEVDFTKMSDDKSRSYWNQLANVYVTKTFRNLEILLTASESTLEVLECVKSLSCYVESLDDAKKQIMASILGHYPSLKNAIEEIQADAATDLLAEVE